MTALRTCRVCGLEAHNEEDLDLFRKRKQSPHERDTICKKCENEHQRGWKGGGLQGRPPDYPPDRWFWFKWDRKTWRKGLPTASWCLQELLETGDLGYLVDAILSMFP